MALRDAGGCRADLVAPARPRAPAPASLADVPRKTAGAHGARAGAQAPAGFRFVGPTTVYAAMQASGLVNDHPAGCLVHDEVEAAQRAVVVPI